jgi:hypothetical protein
MGRTHIYTLVPGSLTQALPIHALDRGPSRPFPVSRMRDEHRVFRAAGGWGVYVCGANPPVLQPLISIGSKFGTLCSCRSCTMCFKLYAAFEMQGRELWPLEELGRLIASRCPGGYLSASYHQPTLSTAISSPSLSLSPYQPTTQ